MLKIYDIVLATLVVVLLQFPLNISMEMTVSEGLDEIIEMMETLLVEYDEQESQLEKTHWTLSLLKYGYNSLRQKLSNAECSASELVSSTVGLDEHIEQSTMSVENINDCLEESEATIDAVEELTHPCGEGEWRLVVDDDYSNPTADDCPSGWAEFTDLTTTRRFCARQSTDFSMHVCDSALFPVSGGEYSKVCGKIVGYGHGSNVAFAIAIGGIDGFYINGLSITHGQNPRQHIWSLVVAETDAVREFATNTMCPCHPEITASTAVPGFVGDDYFCESGNNGNTATFFAHYLDDPLWDGRQCHEDCCNGSSFIKTLSSGPTMDDLEIRICNRQAESSGNILVEKIQIYVQ